MNKYLKYIGIGVLAVALGTIVNSTVSAIDATAKTNWTLWITQSGNDNLFAENYPISNFIKNNYTLFGFFKVLPHLFFLASIFLLFRKKFKSGFITIASPLIITIPLLIWVIIEATQ